MADSDARVRRQCTDSFRKFAKTRWATRRHQPVIVGDCITYDAQETDRVVCTVREWGEHLATAPPGEEDLSGFVPLTIHLVGVEGCITVSTLLAAIDQRIASAAGTLLAHVAVTSGSIAGTLLAAVSGGSAAGSGTEQDPAGSVCARVIARVRDGQLAVVGDGYAAVIDTSSAEALVGTLRAAPGDAFLSAVDRGFLRRTGLRHTEVHGDEQEEEVADDSFHWLYGAPGSKGVEPGLLARVSAAESRLLSLGYRPLPWGALPELLGQDFVRACLREYRDQYEQETVVDFLAHYLGLVYLLL